MLDHGKFILGPEVQRLEECLAQFVGVKHAITCANGTDALTLALMALDIGEGDAVFVPTFTFFASAETIAYAKATPVFVDSDAATFNICPNDLEQKIKAVRDEGRLQPKAIMAVDLFGLPANYIAIKEIADRHSLKIIEDSAQGFGGTIDRKKAGSFGDISTTSFFPAKPLGCYGDGGAIFTDNDEFKALIESYRVHGKGHDKYDNVRIGMNSRLDTIQAAVLLEKLKAFPQELIYRNKLANDYSDFLKDRFKTPRIPRGYTSSWAQYTLVADNTEQRNKIMNHMSENNVPCMTYYRTCLHEQTAFRRLGYQSGDFPVAEELAGRVYSIPMHPYMKNEDKTRILNVISSCD